jgi:hypothetical protein
MALSAPAPGTRVPPVTTVRTAPPESPASAVVGRLGP